jgi:hypothetical protein
MHLTAGSIPVAKKGGAVNASVALNMSLYVIKECSNLSGKVIKIFLLFVALYICETKFTAVAVMKPKYCLKLILEEELSLVCHQ